MFEAFKIYLYICAVIVSIAIIIGLIAILLNVMAYCYQTFIGFGTFKKFLRKYHNEMRAEKIKKADAGVKFNNSGEER